MKFQMLKTILTIVISVTFLGVFFFIIVRNLLRRKLDQLVEDEKKRKLNDLEQFIKLTNIKI